MSQDFFSNTHLEKFGLSSQNVTQLNPKLTLIKKWNWDYSEAHAFQRAALDYIQEQPQSRIVIGCSHPRVFTNGRGLQKPRKGEVLNLVEFDPYMAKNLPFPFHQIERGGGLTFHHPGQLIVYPITRLNPHTLSLSALINDLFDFAIEVFNEWGLNGLSRENKMLGLWAGEQKLASMGIAIEKFTTFHGMALNFFQDQEMKNALQAVNPCGLKAETYTSADELMDLKNKTLEDFSLAYFKRMADAWK